MGCIKQLTVSQTTESTLMLIGEKNTLADCPLVQSTPCQGRNIFASNVSNSPGGLSRLRKEINLDSIVNRD